MAKAVKSINTILAEGNKAHLTKEEIKARKDLESKLKTDREQLIAPPKWLSTAAKKEFTRVVNELARLDLVDNLDLTMLGIYCDAYSKYVELNKVIKKEGLTIQHTNKAGETNTVISPNVQIQQKYIDVIMKCSTKLGLSISDRLKLIIPKMNEKPVNKFEEFI
ncbi:TPA: phage terminase small subunit P27 family [Clostridium perfringens]